MGWDWGPFSSTGVKSLTQDAPSTVTGAFAGLSTWGHAPWQGDAQEGKHVSCPAFSEACCPLSLGLDRRVFQMWFGRPTPTHGKELEGMAYSRSHAPWAVSPPQGPSEPILALPPPSQLVAYSAHDLALAAERMAAEVYGHLLGL